MAVDELLTPYPDIYFTKQYQDLFEDTAFGGEPHQLTACGIDYRFYRNKIQGTVYSDIVSPYGYSGQLAMSKFYDWYGFHNVFHNYCVENNIIAEFARLHPFMKQPVEDKHFEHQIYYIDLTQDEDTIWDYFDKGCKSTIHKQAKEKDSYGNPSIEAFARLYDKRMIQIGATRGYFFMPNFWRKLEDMSVCIGNSEAMVVLLPHGDYCSYFMSASEDKYSVTYALYCGIMNAKRNNHKIFILGGGLKPNDSLESFKRSFSRTTMPFYTYRKVHNQKVYDELSKGIKTDYFPVYRSLEKRG